MLKGIDFSFGNGLTIAQMKARGVQFVCRYLSGGGAKDISADELKAYKKAGMPVVFVWETDGQMPSQSAGVQAAKAANAELTELSKALNDESIAKAVVFFAADASAEPDEIGYLQGVNSVIPMHRVGIYGGFNSVNAAFNAGLVNYGWQTYAWSSGTWDNRAILRQTQNDVVIGPCQADLDYAAYWNSKKILTTADDFGQWPTPPDPTVYTKHLASGKASLHTAAAEARTTVEAIAQATIEAGSGLEIEALLEYLANGDWNFIFARNVGANRKMPQGLAFYTK